jgi:hypothetical protein
MGSLCGIAVKDKRTVVSAAAGTAMTTCAPGP